MTLEVYHITPVPKPRMTQADRWRKRPCVVRYFAFCDECKKHPEMVPQPGDTVFFVMPMPKSWSKKRKAEMYGSVHMQKPDFDNLTKALLDATMKEDKEVWGLCSLKTWGNTGAIVIERANDYDRILLREKCETAVWEAEVMT